MPCYHFDIGNSSEGLLGFCARVRAESKEQAVKYLQEALDEFIGDTVELSVDGYNKDVTTIEYAHIYIGSQNIRAEDIDDQEES